MKRYVHGYKLTIVTSLHNLKKLKMSYFGHIKRHDSLEKTILEGKLEGEKKKRQIKKSMVKRYKKNRNVRQRRRKHSL